MDANRFDGFAKSIANWTTRRRFVGGMAGTAAGGLLGARQTRAQQSDEPADPDVLAAIADGSAKANSELVLFSQEVEAYRQWGISQGNPNFAPYAFDPRFGQFISDLITLTERGKSSPSWNAGQLMDYLLTVNLIVGSVSAGGDTDVQLYEFSVSVFQKKGIGGEVTPAVPDECISPERTPTCAASCLDVWKVRETQFLSTGDMIALVQAFFFFIECYIWKGSITADDECLSTLIEPSCAEEIICSCSGDCH